MGEFNYTNLDERIIVYNNITVLCYINILILQIIKRLIFACPKSISIV